MAKSTKRINPKKGSKTSIALKEEIAIEEGLPLKFVHYPEHYGTFFAFSLSENSELFMCSCNQVLIENYLKISTESNNHYSEDIYNSKYSAKDFPTKISRLSLQENFSIKYKEKICHRCNLKTPTFRYCHEMYGSRFKQYFGWYINQIRLRFSSLRYSLSQYDFLPIELTEVKEKISLLRTRLNKKQIANNPFDKQKFVEISNLSSEITKLERKIDNFFEDICREEFGFRKIGEGNVSELILTKIVQEIYPKEEILMHFRPEWLNKLELDIYLPKLKIAFEYQGQQHFFAIKAWGGENSLKNIKLRDELKRQICKELNIILIEIDFTEPLEINYIKSVIEKHLLYNGK